MLKSLRLRRSVLDCWLLQLITALGFHFRLIDGYHDHRWKILCQQSPIFLNAKTLSTINRSCVRQSQCAFSSEVHVTEVWVSQIKAHKAKKSERLKHISRSCKPGGVWSNCRGNQTPGDGVPRPRQQRSSSFLDLDARHSRLHPALLIGQMTADEPEEGEFELGEEGRFQKSHFRLHWRLWYR